MASNVLNPRILLLLVVLSVSDAKVFLSIDCGATAVYTDDRNISWSLDAPYITTGESFQVSSTGTSTTQTQLNTLRVFKTSPKSCYSINVEKGEQVLVRASFYYGNYDNQNTPPTFQLQLNGNDWGTVVSSIHAPSTFEAITFVADEGIISVCLLRMFAGQYPFISALEVRSLGANMYNSRTNLDNYELNSSSSVMKLKGKRSSRSSSKKSKKKNKIGTEAEIVIGIGVIFLVLAVAILIVLWRRARKAAIAKEKARDVAKNKKAKAPDDTPISEQHILHMSNNTSEQG